MTDFEENLEKSFRIIVFLNKFTGFLPYDNTRSAFYRRIAHAFSLIFVTLTILNSIWYEYPKMKIVLISISLLNSCISTTFKYAFATINRKKLAMFMKTIREEFWKEPENEEEKQIIKKYSLAAFRVHILQVLLYIVIYLLAISKVIKYLFKITVLRENNVKRILLYRNWYSDNIDIYTEPFYEILLAIQVIGVLSMCTLTPSIDSQYACLMFSFSGQLNLLKRRIETFDTDRNTKESQQYLYKCVELHQKLLKFCKEIDSIYSYILCYQIFATVVYVGLAGFLIITFQSSTQLALQKTFVSLIILIQAFIYCFTAQMVTSCGSEIAAAAYNSNWVDAPKNIKNIIYTIILRAQKPLHIHVGPFTPATLVTFQQVLKTTFSMFTVMKTVMVDEKQN